MDLIQLLTELTAADGVAGDENGAADLVMCELSKYGKTYKTRLGSVVCELAPAKEGGEHLLLDAHIDEIGFVVTGITDSGFLRVPPAAAWTAGCCPRRRSPCTAKSRYTV